MHLKSWHVLITTLPVTSSSSFAKEKDQGTCVTGPDSSYTALLPFPFLVCLLTLLHQRSDWKEDDDTKDFRAQLVDLKQVYQFQFIKSVFDSFEDLS